MPTPRTFAEVMVDVESLLASVTMNAEQLPNLDAARAPLDAVLVDLKALATRRDNHKAEKQVLSQQIRSAVKRARELSTNLRALLKGNLGTRNEKLVEFRVAPQREVRRKKAQLSKPVALAVAVPSPVSGPTAGG